LWHTKRIENINVWKRTEAGAGAGSMKKESSGAGAGAMFMKRRAPEADLCPFYDGSTDLVVSRFK